MAKHTYNIVSPFVQRNTNCRVLQQSGMKLGSVYIQYIYTTVMIYHDYTYIQTCFTLCVMQL